MRTRTRRAPRGIAAIVVPSSSIFTGATPGSEFETAGFDRPDKGDGMRLWNLAPRLAALHPDRAFTRKFRDRGELIDHILVSHVLAHALSDVNTADVTPPSITEDPIERRDAPASDHAPLVATFNLS